MTTPVLPRSDDTRSFEIFAFLWACFSLLHQFNTGSWVDNSLEVAMTFGAILTIANPRNLMCFVFLLLAQTATFWHLSPNLVNHAMFAEIANGTLLAGMVWVALRNPGKPIDTGAVYRLVLPVLRVEVVILYFFAVFHKLNVDFFYLDTSASIVHFENLSSMVQKLGLPALPMPDPVRYLVIYGTLLAEGGIPLLCAFARTRILGVWLGLTFHYMLGFEDFYDFSAMAYALLFLFAPADFPTRIDTWLTGTGLRARYSAFRSGRLFRIVPPVLWVGALVLVSLAFFDLYHGRASDRAGKILFMGFGALAMLAWFGAIHGRGQETPEYPAGAFRFASWAFWIFPILVFVNGATPYLGLKTRSAFAMFSNLRTEGGQTNHLLVPVSAQLFAYQRDMVRVEEASHGFQRVVGSGGWIPYFNLRKTMAELSAQGATDIRLVYVRSAVAAGRDVGIPAPDAERDWRDTFGWSPALVRIEELAGERNPELATPHPYLLSKLLLFGGVNPGDRQLNRH